MEIKKAKFVRSLSAFGEFPGQGLPEIAMVGKSNVGKSSLINNLTRNSKLARTSSEPGKTRLVNLFLINESFFLVDLPGYGFAKASKQEMLAITMDMKSQVESSQAAIPASMATALGKGQMGSATPVAPIEPFNNKWK